MLLGADDPIPVDGAADAGKERQAKEEKPKAARAAIKARGKAARGLAARARAGADEPPVCRHQQAEQAAQRPMPATMPDLFNRMAENFARNPAMGFPNFVQELSRYEGSAMEGVTLSLAEERKAGQAARAEYLQRAAQRGYRIVNDPEKLDYLRDLVATIAPRMRNRDRYKHIEVTLIDAPVADGQTFPGGYLVFTTGLLKEPDEATVFGVVAHELAHLDRGHMYQYARRGKLAETAFTGPPGAGDSFDAFFTRGMTLFGLMMNPFRPEHELEADCTALTWMYQEGYDPRALVGFFERMHEQIKDRPADPLFSFWRTHPYSLDRRRHVVDRLAQLQRWRPKRDLGFFAGNLRRLETHGREAAENAKGEPPK